MTSTGNATVKAARRLLRRTGRARAGEAFLVDGPGPVGEALPFLQRLFVTDEGD
ncbi:MAG: RNA methyltransferase, partial [Euzebyales bacterium]|nr:RNA methyltransferase [Euzebyales bacterium]